VSGGSPSRRRGACHPRACHRWPTTTDRAGSLPPPGRQVTERGLRDDQVPLGIADQVLHDSLRLRISGLAPVRPESEGVRREADVLVGASDQAPAGPRRDVDAGISSPHVSRLNTARVDASLGSDAASSSAMQLRVAAPMNSGS